MKKRYYWAGVLALCGMLANAQQRVDLSGTWRFATDRENTGVAEHWFERSLSDEVKLPGTMLTNGKGDAVNIQTRWTGQIVDKSFFYDDRYASYRKADNFKVPFWLQPDTYYAGVAWYQRDIEVPEDWSGKTIRLFFERCHWESRVWIDGTEVDMQNALGAPQEFDLTKYLKPGKHVLSIRIDNQTDRIDPGENSHSISDHTQGNWNGIIGDMYMEVLSPIHAGQIDLYPSLADRQLKVNMNVRNTGSKAEKVTIDFRLEQQKTVQRQVLQPGDNALEITLPLPAEVAAWDEFHPNLYTLTYTLRSGKKELDSRSLTFGCRDWSVQDGVLHLNGHPAFMRGTLHCAAFPLTGFPATDKEEWLREFRICKDHGINHVRFHSWCPPEVAFAAADELGMYLQIECSSWANQSTTLGDGKPIDSFIYEEAERIVKAYGNHPSFCLFAYGNEPGGNRHKDYLTNLVSYWKAKDARRLYTSAAGWPNLPVNDYLNAPEPRIQHWGAGLTSIINGEAPATTYDWSAHTSRFTQPFISHEIGQWCVYPDFKEMKKYTGVYKPRNYEIFRETLEQAGLLAQADSFLIASGKLQTLCYKADIEAALRTPKFGGFQLLGLNDFPGQGTALVGTLDVFWEEKGYVTPEAYRRFCNSIVPLARIPKLLMDNNESFTAQIEVANYKEELTNPDVKWVVRNDAGQIIAQGTLPVEKLAIGNCQSVGTVKVDLNGVKQASHLNLEVSVNDFANDWDFWVYPAQKEALDAEAVLLTNTLNQAAIDRLNAGGKVLLSLKKGALSKAFGGDIQIGFSSIFWNTAWTQGQAPHTLGILCNPSHPALAEFPTEFYSNYQWWDAMSHSGAIHIGKLSKDIHPIVRVIDDWFTNRSLALLFEVQVGAGKLLVSGIDFHQDIEQRPAARQLLHSLKKYMQSDAFHPQMAMEVEQINLLTEE